MSHMEKCLILFHFSLFGFTLVIKLINFDFEIHVNTLIFFNKKNYVLRFEYVS